MGALLKISKPLPAHLKPFFKTKSGCGACYICRLVGIFDEVRRVLRKDGVCFVVIRDSHCSGGRRGHGTRVGYLQQTVRGMNGVNDPPRPPQPLGLKPKDLCGIPYRFALAMQAAGWWWRIEVIWEKENAKPESVQDRPSYVHEQVLLFTKSARYYWDREAVKEECQGVDDQTAPGSEAGRNIRTVWHINTEPYKGSFYAAMPTELVRRCLLAGTSEKGCCSACGKPWRRVLDKTKDWREDAYTKPREDAYTKPQDYINSGNRTARSHSGGMSKNQYKTIGWKPSCTCEAPTQPCAVLDPFMGRGTVALVAQEHFRRSINIDLDVRNLRLVRHSLKDEVLPFGLQNTLQNGSSVNGHGSITHREEIPCPVRNSALAIPTTRRTT